MKTNKRYSIEHINDIFEIPEESFSNFLTDLTKYYQHGRSTKIATQNLNDAGIKVKSTFANFVWIDDGKHEVTVNLQVKNFDEEKK